MRPGWRSLLGMTLVAPGLLIVTLGQTRGDGEEPGRLGLGFGRLFRFGGSSSPASAPAEKAPSLPPAGTPATPSPSYPAPGPTTEVSTPSSSGTSGTPRIVPRPRVARPLTESDPILTRITINRSDDGNQFGMFLQVFADGTVIDGEGVHHVGQDALRPIIEALQAGDLYRLKGHCGAPATDYVESVQLIVYERYLGRLRANSFSYSGNPQGCDNSVRNLHATLDALQSKITRPMTIPAGPPAGIVPGPGPSTTAPPGGSQTVIPLSAPN